MRVKALQDRCVAKEGVITRVRKHNSNLLAQQKQYKEALRTLNVELKETREKLEGAGSRNNKLEDKLMTLHKQVEKAGADAFQEFKASQSYIDSCVNYYSTGFDDCLKQVASTFIELDLSGITMEDSVPTTPAGDTVADEGDNPMELGLPPKDGGDILAQPTANPPVPASNLSIKLLDVENPPAQDKGDGISTDAPAA